MNLQLNLFDTVYIIPSHSSPPPPPMTHFILPTLVVFPVKRPPPPPHLAPRSACVLARVISPGVVMV